MNREKYWCIGDRAAREGGGLKRRRRRYEWGLYRPRRTAGLYPHCRCKLSAPSDGDSNDERKSALYPTRYACDVQPSPLLRCYPQSLQSLYYTSHTSANVLACFFWPVPFFQFPQSARSVDTFNLGAIFTQFYSPSYVYVHNCQACKS